MAKEKLNCTEVAKQVTTIVKSATGSYDELKALEKSLLDNAAFIGKAAGKLRVKALLEVQAKLDELKEGITEEEIEEYTKKLEAIKERTLKAQAAKQAKKQENL